MNLLALTIAAMAVAGGPPNPLIVDWGPKPLDMVYPSGTTLWIDADGFETDFSVNGFIDAHTWGFNSFQLSDWYTAPGTYCVSINARDSLGVAETESIHWVVESVHRADLNGDWVVDGSDFLVWQGNFPKVDTFLPYRGDADGNRIVDGNDFLVWQVAYDSNAIPSILAAVPEPGSVSLLIAGALLILRRRK
jgi:hypothetical protein